MEDIWKPLVLVLAGLLAGIVNTIAGGGSLMTLPLLIFLGLPPNAANATNRLGIIFQTSVASFKDKAWFAFGAERSIAFSAIFGHNSIAA